MSTHNLPRTDRNPPALSAPQPQAQPETVASTATHEVAAALDRDLTRELEGLPPIVCFANDWFTDPTSKHHIMRTFGRRTDVLWVESSGMRRPNLANAADLSRIFSKARKAFGGLQRIPDSNVAVLSPPAIPIPGVRLVSRLNATLYRRSIQSARRQLGQADTSPLLWVYTPTVARYIDHLPHQGLVYHCVDRWWAFSDLDSAEMKACHEILCRKADVVFASAKTLLDDCLPFTDRAVLVRHGVDWEHFAAAALEPLARPPDLPNDGSPILGFFGLIQDWVDLELLRKLSERFSDSYVAVLGRSTIDLAPITGIPNLLLLGQKPYQELPKYCQAFAVGLIPFVLNELTDAVNPIKLREYLSAGLPVVSTAMPEVIALGRIDGLHVVRTHEQFIAAVAEILEKPASAGERRVRATKFAAEGWQGRCLLMAQQTRQRINDR